MSVFIDGSTLASLLYSLSNSAGNQEGLLLGQIVSHVKDHISDSQINNAQVQTFMCVSSHIPWPSEDRVYSRGGVPIMEKMAALLGKSHGDEEVVGWYSFRRNSSLYMSMKERTLHKHLANRFSHEKEDQFLFFMCVSSATTECSTHSLDHCFVSVSVEPDEGGMKKMATVVTNLGDTLHTQYKTHAGSGLSQSSAVRNILHQFRSQFLSQSDQMEEVKKIDDMSNTLTNSLQKLCKQVAESEHQTGELEREVLQLREQLLQREEEQILAQQPMKTESSTDGGHIYPYLPPADSAWPSGEDQEPVVNQAPVQQRLVVDLGNVSKDQTSLPEAEPSVDDLLSIPTTSDLQNNRGADDDALQPVISSTLDSPPPSYTAPSTTRKAAAPVLQSVVDTITDFDEEDVQTSDSSSSKSSTKLSDGVSQKGNLTLNNANNTKPTVLSDTSKPKDHFAFVDNLLTSENGSSHKKTATVPTGATLTYSPRTTRSQAKTSTDSNKSSAKEKSKPQNTQTTGLGTHSKTDAHPSPKTDGQSSKTVLSSKPSSRDSHSALSSRMQVKRDSSPKAEDKVKNCNPKEGSRAKPTQSSSGGSDSKPRLKLNPSNFDLEGRQRNRPPVTAGGKKSAKSGSDSECDRGDSTLQENGNVDNVQNVDNSVYPSSSPIF